MSILQTAPAPAPTRSIQQPGAGSAAGHRLRVGLAIALGLAIGWQAALAGQFLSGNGSALRLHEYGAYVTFLLAFATVIAEVVSGRRARRWGIVALAGLLLVAIMVQFELGYVSAAHAQGLAYHIPLGVSIAGLYVWYLTLRLRRPA